MQSFAQLVMFSPLAGSQTLLLLQVGPLPQQSAFTGALTAPIVTNPKPAIKPIAKATANTPTQVFFAMVGLLSQGNYLCQKGQICK